MKYFCNPLNLEYKYQYHRQNQSEQGYRMFREAADPSVIFFHDRFYLFASMAKGVYVSADMIKWDYHELLDEKLPVYDYAPDARVIGDYVYLCASQSTGPCSFYRTKDILEGEWEEIQGEFSFWDPDLFEDDDGRLYFYWGCSNTEPLWGVELSADTLQPIGEKRALLSSDTYRLGFERFGENHTAPWTENEIEERYRDYLRQIGKREEELSETEKKKYRVFVGNGTYIEGAWMTKWKGKYYLQAACTGTEFNIYCDAVYISDKPLGPFAPAVSNPYSYHPGGFMTGAGHGSTFQDKRGKWWHAASMRISMQHSFERRIGIWKAGFSEDGELYCDQSYGDWPIALRENGSAYTPWYLLSYGKRTWASSWEDGYEPQKAVDEDVRTWWKAGEKKAGEWLKTDLGKSMDIRAVQLNFADDGVIAPLPEGKRLCGKEAYIQRYIPPHSEPIRWKLEASLDDCHYEIIEDKSAVSSSLAHDFLVWEKGISARYLKLTIYQIPYRQAACVSGLRIFGFGGGTQPEKPVFRAVRCGSLDMEVTVENGNKKRTGTDGYLILWGTQPDKLYHSFQTFNTKQRIGALIKNQVYCVRVDAFNDSGIVQGEIQWIERNCNEEDRFESELGIL